MSDKLSVREALADLLAWLDEKPKPLSESIKDDEPLRKIERARAALSSPDDTAERLAEADAVIASGYGYDTTLTDVQREDALVAAVTRHRARMAKAAPPKEGT